MAGLADDAPMRLTVVGGREGPLECLLTIDEAVIDGARAVRMLADLRDGFAAPLRVLV